MFEYYTLLADQADKQSSAKGNNIQPTAKPKDKNLDLNKWFLYQL